MGSPVYQRRFAPPDPYERLNLQLRLMEIQAQQEARFEARRDQALSRTLDAVSGGMSSKDALTAFGADLPANLIPVVQQIEKQRKEQESKKALQQGLEPSAVNRFASAVQPTVTPRGQIQPVDESAAWAGAYPPGLAPEDEPAFTAALMAARQGAYNRAGAVVGEKRFNVAQNIGQTAAETRIRESSDTRMLERQQAAQGLAQAKAAASSYIANAELGLVSPEQRDQAIADLRSLGATDADLVEVKLRAQSDAVKQAAATQTGASDQEKLTRSWQNLGGYDEDSARLIAAGQAAPNPFGGVALGIKPGSAQHAKIGAYAELHSQIQGLVRSAGEVARSGSGGIANPEFVVEGKAQAGMLSPAAADYDSRRRITTNAIVRAFQDGKISDADFKIAIATLPRFTELTMVGGQLNPTAQARFNAILSMLETSASSIVGMTPGARFSPTPETSALADAAQKYAAGEITDEQLDEAVRKQGGRLPTPIPPALIPPGSKGAKWAREELGY